MRTRRRGFMLIEVLTILMILGIGGTLMAVALSSILRSQQRVADLSNHYAKVTDFIQCFSRDVRMSSTAVLSEGDGDDLRQVLVVGEPPCQVTFRFYSQRVERVGCMGSPVTTKLWTPLDVGVNKIIGPFEAGGTAVDVTVRWHRTDKKDPEPDRRFDLIVRCAGELDDEAN